MNYPTKKIDASITVSAQYDDKVIVRIKDKTSGVPFIELELSHEQFVNATMNRLAECDVRSTTVYGLEYVGKKAERMPIVVEIPKYHDKKAAIEKTVRSCPVGWITELYFDSQESFFERDGKYFAKSYIFRWV